jgi:hypothetical protein
MGKIIASWFISPVSAALITCFLMTIVAKFVLDTGSRSFRARLQTLSIISGSCASIVSFIMAKLLGVAGDQAAVLVIISVLAFPVGVILIRLAILYVIYS